MAGKINGFIMDLQIKTICNRESLGDYLGIFEKYFDVIGNHLTDYQLFDSTNTVICFGSLLSKLPSCDRCQGGCVEIQDKWNLGLSDSMWEHIQLNKEDYKFMRTEVGDYNRRLCDGSLILSIKNSEYNRVIGEFCPYKNILITSDWTHDGTKTQVVNDILLQMCNAKLINLKLHNKKKPKIMLGADPEFEYIDPDTDDILSCKDMGILDRIPINSSSPIGRIGIDGSGQQRELRPEPSSTPEGLIENFEKLIREGLDEIWSLRGERFSCGGHIHIGGVEVSRDFGILLDYYLGPLDVLNSMIRLHSGYGKKGSPDNIRKQDWGMEYRTPPVGWLASKELALITLKIVKFAAEKHFSGEDIEVTDNINKDLEDLGITKKEIKIFFNEIEKYKIQGLPRDFKKAWGYNVPLKFVIEFRDDWNKDVKQYLRTIVLNMGVKEKLEGRCVFYGLSSDRGNVFSVVMAHMNGIEMPENYGFMPPIKTSAIKNHVGIPYTIRNNITEVKEMKETILEIIRRTINPPMVKKSQRKKSIERIPVVHEGELPSME